MNRILAASTITFAAAGAAMGGSLTPIPADPAPLAPAPVVADWSGFYVGALASFQSGDVIVDPGTPGEFTLATDATAYGGFVGYNFQQGSIVYGAEVAAQMGTANLGAISADLDYLVDARLRVGYAFDTVMVYAAGGYSVGQASFGGNSYDAAGFNLGAGIELNVTDNLFIGGEYIYRNMNGSALGSDYDYNTHGVQVRAGYRF